MVCLHTDTMGVHPACILFDGQGYSPPRPGIPPETTPPILHILPLIAHQLASARQFSRSCRVNFHANGLGVRLLSCSYNAKRRRTASKVAKSFGVSTFRWMIEK